MFETLVVIFLLMVLAHFVADYILQSDFIAQNKSPDGPNHIPWPYVLSAHVSGHALAIYIITGSMFLSILEFVAHFVIDWCKCKGYINIHQDQFAHILCKLIWCLIIASWVSSVS